MVCKFLLHKQLPSQLAHIKWVSDGFCDFTLPLGTSQELDLAIRSFKMMSSFEIWRRNNFQNFIAGVLEVRYKTFFFSLSNSGMGLKMGYGCLQNVILCFFLVLTYLQYQAEGSCLAATSVHE